MREECKVCHSEGFHKTNQCPDDYLIQTPYGKKWASLLVEAMDAYNSNAATKK